jgi:hypothetical protein
MALDPHGLANSREPQIVVWHDHGGVDLVYRCRTKAEAARFVFAQDDPDNYFVHGYLDWPQSADITVITVTPEDRTGEE